MEEKNFNGVGSGVVPHFLKLVEQEKDVSSGIAAIKTLLMMLEANEFNTIHVLDKCMEEAVLAMCQTDLSMAAIMSGGELFRRFITFSIENKNMDECRSIMLERGRAFLDKLLNASNVVAKNAQRFIADDCKILTHCRSRVVLRALREAAKSQKSFQVYVTRGEPGCEGAQMVAELQESGVDATLILDSAVGYIMESVDMVMVGAEAVVQSGGILNRMGSLTMSVCARQLNKPFYALVESFKFTRLYPFNQQDVPKEYKYAKKDLADMAKAHPRLDYTPPEFITLLFTDLGVLTTSAVPDELIKLYV